MTDKLTKIINTLKRHIAAFSCLAALFLTVLIVVAVFSFAEEEASEAGDWGDGITEGIPAFRPGTEELVFGGDGSYAAAYYSEVTGEQAETYIAALEAECGIAFGGAQYPRTAVYGEKLIAIHYNATEMKLSVTVTLKNIGETTQIGEQQ